LTAIDNCKDQLPDTQSEPGKNALVSLEAAAKKCNQFINAHMMMAAKREHNVKDLGLYIKSVDMVDTDRKREIRYMNWTYSSLHAEILWLSSNQARLSSLLGDVQKYNFDLQQTNCELKKQHSFRIYEHGLGIYALDAEREKSESDLAVAMHALDARDVKNRTLISDIEIALQALNNDHEEQKRQLRCQRDTSHRETESSLAFQQTVLMSVGQLQQKNEAQAARLSANDGEISSLRQEQEKKLAELDLAKQVAMANNGQIAQLSLDLSSKDGEIGHLRQEQDRALAELDLVKRDAMTRDGDIAQLNFEKDGLSKELHETKRADEAKTAVVEEVRLKKANISAQLDTTLSYLKKTINQKHMISKQLEIAQQANGESNASLARALREKDDIASQLQQLKQYDEAKAIIIEDIRREKVEVSAKLDMSSSNLKKMIEEKGIISMQLNISQQANEKQSADLARALQEKDEILSQIRELKQAGEMKAIQIKTLELEHKKLSSQLRVSREDVQAKAAEISCANESKEKVEFALKSFSKEHVAQIEEMKAAHQVATKEKFEAAQKDAEATTNETRRDFSTAIDTLFEKKKKLLAEKEEASAQSEASRAVYERSKEEAKDLQSKLDDANSHSAYLQDANNKQKADLNLERERFAGELAALQHMLEDAGACSEALRKANDEQKASIELEREKHADDLPLFSTSLKMGTHTRRFSSKRTTSGMQLLRHRATSSSSSSKIWRKSRSSFLRHMNRSMSFKSSAKRLSANKPIRPNRTSGRSEISRRTWGLSKLSSRMHSSKSRKSEVSATIL
jgi:hypothetical protein